MRKDKMPPEAFGEDESRGTFELAVALKDRNELGDLYERLSEEGHECWVQKCEEE